MPPIVGTEYLFGVLVMLTFLFLRKRKAGKVATMMDTVDSMCDHILSSTGPLDIAVGSVVESLVALVTWTRRTSAMATMMAAREKRTTSPNLCVREMVRFRNRWRGRIMAVKSSVGFD